jgi:hypothetical protein
VIEEAGDLDAVLALLPAGNEPDTLISTCASRPDLHQPPRRTAPKTAAHHPDRGVDGRRRDV